MVGITTVLVSVFVVYGVSRSMNNIQNQFDMLRGCCLLLFFLSFGCVNHQRNDNNLPVIEVNPMKFKRNKLLSEIATSVKVIPLQKSENVLFGNIEHIKVLNGYLYMHDPNQTKSITVFDTEGNYISQLKKLGQGPGEYPDIYSFSPYKDKVYIYSRARKAFFVYSFPDMDFVKIINTDDYISNFEAVSDKLLYFAEGAKTSDYKSLYFSPLSDKFEEINLPNASATIELAYPNTVARKNEKEIIYASQGEYTTLYDITDTKATPLVHIDFGKNKIPSEYWSESIAESFEEAFEKDPPKATWVQNPIITDTQISFYNIFANPDVKQLTVYDRTLKSAQVYYQLYLEEGYNAIPYPIGVYNDYYLSLIYAEEIDDLLPSDTSLLDTSWKKKIRENDKEGKVLLFMFKI